MSSKHQKNPGLLIIVLASTALLATMLAAPLPAQEQQPEPAEATDVDDAKVTFENRTGDAVFVLAVYGEGQCAEKPERAQIEIAAKESQEVDTAGTEACWCSSPSGKVGNCTIWKKAKPGKTVRIR